MKAIRRFWSQPSTHYRNFQIVFAALFLNFAIPVGFYVFAPDVAISQFEQINVLLGGSAWNFGENQGYFWRILGIANVATLGFMCLWVMLNLRDRFIGVVPLVFLKAAAAVGWGVAYLQAPEHPVLLAASIFDVLTCAAMGVFTVLGLADIQDKPDAALVPEPARSDLRGWARFEQRWAESALAATIPPSEDGRVPGVGELDLASFWPEFARDMPMHYRLGLRAAAWVVTFWPIFTLRSFRTFHGISDDARDEILRAIDDSDSFFVRQITFVLKSVAAFAYFRDARGQSLYPSAYPGMSCRQDPQDPKPRQGGEDMPDEMTESVESSPNSIGAE